MDNLIDNLAIRVVTEDDEQNVLSIRKPDEVYEGLDYLPDMFRRLITFLNSTGYAVFNGEKCIAFALTSVFDDGETYAIRAVRVAKQYEGRGIVKWFVGKIDEILKATGTIKYRVSTTYRGDVNTARRVKQGKCYTVDDTVGIKLWPQKEMVYFINEIEVQDLKPKFQKFNYSNLVVIDINALFNILDSLNVTYINNRIVANSVPFRPIKSNASFIMQESTLVIGSNLENIDHYLISFGSRFEASVGTVLYIFFYGRVSNDVQSHIMLHLNYVLETCRGKDLTIGLCYDLDTPYNFIERIMKNCCFIAKDFGQTGSWSVETNLYL